MGLFMVLPLAVALAINNLVLFWDDNPSLLVFIGIAILGYTTVLGTVGAMVGGYMVGRSSRKTEAGTDRLGL
jgi:hypothetical protein